MYWDLLPNLDGPWDGVDSCGESDFERGCWEAKCGEVVTPGVWDSKGVNDLDRWENEGVDDLDRWENEGVDDLAESNPTECERCISLSEPLSSEPSEDSEPDIMPEWCTTLRPMEGFSFNLHRVR